MRETPCVSNSRKNCGTFYASQRDGMAVMFSGASAGKPTKGRSIRLDLALWWQLETGPKEARA